MKKPASQVMAEATAKRLQKQGGLILLKLLSRLLMRVSLIVITVYVTVHFLRYMEVI